MPEVEKKLNDLGYQLPPPRTTMAGNFVSAVRTGNLVYLSGHGPSLPDFRESPAVANGGSDLLVSIYGDAGRHARSAVGMAMLPGQMAVEIEMIVEVED